MALFYEAMYGKLRLGLETWDPNPFINLSKTRSLASQWKMLMMKPTESVGKKWSENIHCLIWCNMQSVGFLDARRESRDNWPMQHWDSDRYIKTLVGTVTREYCFTVTISLLESN